MISDPKRVKSTRSLLTGTARPVTNSVERAREYFKGHPASTAAPEKERKNFRKKRREDEAEESPTEPNTDKPEREGEEEVEDEH
jgi:hypothetical protein